MHNIILYQPHAWFNDTVGEDKLVNEVCVAMQVILT